MTYTPFFVHGETRPARWLITCDHATNTVPPQVAGGDLGLPREDMERHIGYDVGAYGVAQHLGVLLDAPVIAANFSRLVIDPNRGEDDPTLLMKLYDGSIIPGNRHAGLATRQTGDQPSQASAAFRASSLPVRSRRHSRAESGLRRPGRSRP